MYERIFDELLPMLERLGDVSQSPRYHPEGDALFHSLQVYRHARAESADVELWAAALLHDVGKGEPAECHAQAGGQMLAPFARDRVCWCVAHHLDLMRSARRTRQWLRGEPALRDLTLLRRWDLRGREPHPQFGLPDAEEALGELLTPGVAEHWLLDDASVEDAQL